MSLFLYSQTQKFRLCSLNLKLSDRILIGYGKDEQVMAGYFFGISCSVGSTYNYAGKLFNKDRILNKKSNCACFLTMTYLSRFSKVFKSDKRLLLSSGREIMMNLIDSNVKCATFSDIFSAKEIGMLQTRLVFLFLKALSCLSRHLSPNMRLGQV